MIYLIYGDSNKIFKKANFLIDFLLKKNFGSNVLKIDNDNFDQFDFNELIGGQSLFTLKQIVYLKRLFEKTDYSEKLLSILKEIAKSQNIFIIVEEKINKPILLKLEKLAEKVQKFEIGKNKIKKEKSHFDLTDAFASRNSKRAWLLYRQKILKNRPEELHGILWWQIKTMLLARKSKNAEDAKLTPFVFLKAQNFNKSYSNEELEKISDDFIDIIQKSRRGGLDLELALERLILNI